MSAHVAGLCPLWQEMGLLSVKAGCIKVPVEVGSPECMVVCFLPAVSGLQEAFHGLGLGVGRKCWGHPNFSLPVSP